MRKTSQVYRVLLMVECLTLAENKTEAMILAKERIRYGQTIVSKVKKRGSISPISVNWVEQETKKKKRHKRVRKETMKIRS